MTLSLFAGPYISGSGGVNTYKFDKGSTGGSLGGAIGYEFSNLRAELEGMLYPGGDIGATLMINGGLTLPLSHFCPYAMIGGGIAGGMGGGTFTGQGILGVDTPITPCTLIGLRYRILHLQQHSVELTLRRRF